MTKMAQQKFLKLALLIADESKDINKTEQMAVVVRYTDETADERNLTFVEAKDLTAAGLSSKLLFVLKSLKLDSSNIRMISQFHKATMVLQ